MLNAYRVMILLLFTVIPIYFLQEKPFCESKATVCKPANKWLVRLAMTRKYFCLIWFVQEDRVERRISFCAWVVRDGFHLHAWMEASSTLCHWPEWWHVVFWHIQLDFLKNLWLRFQGLGNYHRGQSFEGAVHKAASTGRVQLGFSDFPWRNGPPCVANFL